MEELAKGTEPPGSIGEGVCELVFFGVCWNGEFAVFSIFLTDGKRYKRSVGVALSMVKQVKLNPNLRTTNKFAEINPKA
jgi:hypothetical protein